MLTHVHADLVHVADDLGDVAAAVEPQVHAQTVGQSHLAGVAGFEDRAPQLRVDHEAALGAPVVGQVDAVKALGGGDAEQFALEIENPVEEGLGAFTLDHEVQHAAFEAAQERIGCEAGDAQAGQPVTVAGTRLEFLDPAQAFLGPQRGEGVVLQIVPTGQDRFAGAGPWCRRPAAPRRSPTRSGCFPQRTDYRRGSRLRGDRG